MGSTRAANKRKTLHKPTIEHKTEKGDIQKEKKFLPGDIRERGHIQAQIQVMNGGALEL